MSPMLVILPCAGLGTRLALPYPKEIHRITKSRSLIDFSLQHVFACPEIVGDVVTVVAPGKETVFDFASRRLASVTGASAVYFNDKYSEWPGSIRSAEGRFLDRNVALLPDSVLVAREGQKILAQFSEAFDRGADLVFAYVAETDLTRLSALGALRVEGCAVEAFCDKPNPSNVSQFNGFWASFGFTKDCGKEVLDFMMKSVAREPVDINTLGLNIQAFEVESYMDLGTWPNIAKFLASETVLT